MGWGNYLVKTADQNKLGKYMRDLRRENPSVEFRRFSPSGGTYTAVVWGDCSIIFRCSRCQALRCIGCGLAVIEDLDAETAVCAELDANLPVAEECKL